MGTMQHHDAVTGTEKQAVAEDYAKRVGSVSIEYERYDFTSQVVFMILGLD